MTMFGKDARMASVTSRLSKLKGRPAKAEGGKVAVVNKTGPKAASDFLRAEGDMPKARADKPSRSAYASGGRTKSPTTVNVVVAPRGGDDKVMPMPMGLPPMPPAGASPMPPPAPSGPPPSTTLALKTGGRVPRKSGGRVAKAEGGDVSEEPARGRGEAKRIDADDRGTARLGKRMPKATGGAASDQVPMSDKGESAARRLDSYTQGKRNGGRVKDAGAGSGLGRLEKY